MRTRLRPMPDRAALDRMYAAPHQHTVWAEHRVRVDVMGGLAHHLVPERGTVADLSCGDGAIAKRLAASHQATIVLGDYAPGYPIHGPIEETIDQIDTVDLFICSETVEHLDDPDTVLRSIRSRTDRLLLSTPDGEDNDQNPEHVWAWDADAMKGMLRNAGFMPEFFLALDTRPGGGTYRYQIWACK